MLNQFCLVGRLVSDPEIIETENGGKKATITIAVSRPFKNSEGIFENDFIPIDLFGGIAENTKEYCKKGDLIGVKGRIQTRFIEKEDGTKNKIIEVVAEKITFLATGKEEE